MVEPSMQKVHRIGHARDRLFVDGLALVADVGDLAARFQILELGFRAERIPELGAQAREGDGSDAGDEDRENNQSLDGFHASRIICFHPVDRVSEKSVSV